MKTECINDKWCFYKNVKEDDKLCNLQCIELSLPHTWNNLDGQDGGGNYFRGKCCYVKQLVIDKKQDKDYYLEFQGSNSITKVYINDCYVGEHLGGFSKFRFDITNLVFDGNNMLKVFVDNTANDYTYPQMADFTFFGGIYRSVFLHEVNKTRFDMDYFASDGILVTPKLDGYEKAIVNIKAFVKNPLQGQLLNLQIKLNDTVVAKTSLDIMDTQTNIEIENPVLWNGVYNPVLYNLTAIIEQNGEILDERKVNFGIRNFKVDENGFYLNGKKYLLKGVSRHQDRQDKGWAIGVEEQDEDMRLILEVGATAVRLAHYQHNEYFYDLCDKSGLIVWAEIPYISNHLVDAKENAYMQMQELIAQNYNHPSIMFWGVSNEITIGGESEDLIDFHHQLNDLCHTLDKTRLTTIANVTMLNTNSRLTNITDIMAYNHYFGWYIGSVEDNAKWLDDFRQKYPTKPIAISEYGAEAVIKLHSSQPKKGDYSEEYQALYHEKILEIFEKRDYLWATFVWNMFDFACDMRDEGGVKGRNNKGLVTFDRKTKKDSFYLYKAYWSSEPFVHIAGKRYKNRAISDILLKVYSNQQEITLFLNGEKIESKKGNKVFEFYVKLKKGENLLKVECNGIFDTATLNLVEEESDEYMLKDNKQTINWFEKDGKKVQFKFPDGRYCIKDKIGELLNNTKTCEILKNVTTALKKQTGFDFDLNGDMIKLLENMSIEQVVMLSGNKISPEQLYQINNELIMVEKQ